MSTAIKRIICDCVSTVIVIFCLSCIPCLIEDITFKIISSMSYAIFFIILNCLIYCLILWCVKNYCSETLNRCLKTGEFIVILTGLIGLLLFVQDIKQSYSRTRIELLDAWITSESVLLGIESYKNIYGFPYIKSNYHTEDEYQLMMEENKIKYQWINEIDSLITTSLRVFEIENIPKLENKYQDQTYKTVIETLNRINSYNKEIMYLRRIVDSNKMGLITLGTYILLIAISLQISIFFFKK